MDSMILVQIIAAFLFVIGLMITMTRRNTIMILMGIELMLNSANLSMVGFSNSMGIIDGQMQVLFVITLAAAESAIGLSILVNLYRNFGSVQTNVADQLKG